MFKKKTFILVQIWTKLVNMSAIVFMFVCSVSVFIITVLYVYCYYVCYLHVLVNTC